MKVLNSGQSIRLSKSKEGMSAGKVVFGRNADGRKTVGLSIDPRAYESLFRTIAQQQDREYVDLTPQMLEDVKVALIEDNRYNEGYERMSKV